MNYQLKLDDIIKRQGGVKKRLLLHACCAPCSSYVLEYLTAYFDTGLSFYNPNIQPAAEYEKRLGAIHRLLDSMPSANGVRLIETGRREDDFVKAAAGLEAEPEGAKRCEACIRLRLGETAKLAAETGYDYFCSTLSISPHKNAVMLNTLGEAAGKEYGAAWLPNDFKKRGGYLRSIELCARYGIYRQSYCGCVFSAGIKSD